MSEPPRKPSLSKCWRWALVFYAANVLRFVIVVNLDNGRSVGNVLDGLGLGVVWLPMATVAALPLVFSSPFGALQVFLYVAFGIKPIGME